MLVAFMHELFRLPFLIFKVKFTLLKTKIKVLATTSLLHPSMRTVLYANKPGKMQSVLECRKFPEALFPLYILNLHTRRDTFPKYQNLLL
jgi:hypothetical protein